VTIHLPQAVRACLVERILDMLRVAANPPEDPWVGPPCSKVFLRQRQDVSVPSLRFLEGPKEGTDEALQEFERDAEREILSWKSRFDLARVVSAWEVAAGNVRELDPSELESIRRGDLYGAFYENAIVDFWTEVLAGRVHVDWNFGPSRRWEETCRILRRDGGVALDEPVIRWESYRTTTSRPPFGDPLDPARTATARSVRDHLLDCIRAMMREVARHGGNPEVGPPCSKFYLRERRDGSGSPTSDTLAVLEIAEGEVRELDVRDHPKVDHGTVRDGFYENAIVDFWTEPEARLLHVDWRFGPTNGLGHTLEVTRRDGGVILKETAVRWQS
jgi:hypothetical protein